MLAGNPSDTPDTTTEFGCSNQLLNRLDRKAFELLRPHLERVELPAGEMIHAADVSVDYVYFPDSGLASMAQPIAAGAAVEIGLIGKEGLIGANLALMADRSPYLVRIVLPGRGRRMRAPAFRSALEQSGDLHGTILLYAQALTVQLAETAACNAKQALDARVARWLLMCQDRVARDDIDVTHATIAANLAVRRAGVTDALHVLEGDHAIRSLRGRIIVLDRARLESAAKGSYGIAEGEYRRLLPAREDVTAAVA